MAPWDCTDTEACLADLTKFINRKLVRLNGLVVVTTIFAGILVGISFYRPRYRQHHAFVRLLFYGATTLFLPIVSYVISTGENMNADYYNYTSHHDRRKYTNDYDLRQLTHLVLLLVWACLIQMVQTVGISNGATVAADDREAGRNTGLPVAPLLQAIWAAYLVLSMPTAYFTIRDIIRDILEGLISFLLLGAFALIFARLVVKCFAFLMAQRSLALGHNPRLIVGYMKQLMLQQDVVVLHHDHDLSPPPPPPLIVMGEERQKVEKQPHGYYLKRLMPNQQAAPGTSYIATMNNDSLVTIDKIWQLQEESAPVSSKDLCLSFALFKILRCRFAGYSTAAYATTIAHDFIWQLLFLTATAGSGNDNNDHDRLLGVITNELSFLHDFYYSSLPISYSKSWLPVLSFLISLFTICYCLLVGILVIVFQLVLRELSGWSQIYVYQLVCKGTDYQSCEYASIGSLFYNIVPIFVLLALVVLAEAREIASCICSNWAKVALISRQLNSINKSRLQKYVTAVLLRCRCNLVNPLDDKMRQCSIILPAPFLSRKTYSSVKVPTAVKAAIVDTLRTNNGQLSNGVRFLNLQDDHHDFLWACCTDDVILGTTDVMLVWHIGTSILEVRLQHPPSSGSQIVATHLSRYCAYLVACCPELLPDDDKWSKSLYDAVSKDITRALAKFRCRRRRGGADVLYEEMVALLNDKSEHEVVKKGTRLGKQLTELDDEEAAWSLLAGVWSEMILYVAPSENLNAHSDAIARGGELITVVWALLMHLGIYTRPADVRH